MLIKWDKEREREREEHTECLESWRRYLNKLSMKNKNLPIEDDSSNLDEALNQKKNSAKIMVVEIPR